MLLLDLRIFFIYNTENSTSTRKYKTTNFLTQNLKYKSYVLLCCNRFVVLFYVRATFSPMKEDNVVFHCLLWTVKIRNNFVNINTPLFCSSVIRIQSVKHETTY